MLSFPLGMVATLLIALVALTNQYNKSTSLLSNIRVIKSNYNAEKRHRLMDGDNYTLPPDHGNYSNISENKSIHRDKNTEGKMSLGCQGRACGDLGDSSKGNLLETTPTNDRWKTSWHSQFVNATERDQIITSTTTTEKGEMLPTSVRSKVTGDKSIIETQIQATEKGNNVERMSISLREGINRNNFITPSGNSSKRSGEELMTSTTTSTTTSYSIGDVEHTFGFWPEVLAKKRRLMEEKKVPDDERKWSFVSTTTRAFSVKRGRDVQSKVNKKTFLSSPVKNQSIIATETKGYAINDTTSSDPLSYGGPLDKGPDRLTPTGSPSEMTTLSTYHIDPDTQIFRGSVSPYGITFRDVSESITTKSAQSPTSSFRGDGISGGEGIVVSTTEESSLRPMWEQNREVVDYNSDTKTFYFTKHPPTTKTTTTPASFPSDENASSTTTQLHFSANKSKTYGLMTYGKMDRGDGSNELKSRLNDTLLLETRFVNKSSSGVDSLFRTAVITTTATATKSTTISTIDEDVANSSSEISVNNKVLLQQELAWWPVKKEAVVEGDLVLGGLMMVHEREDTITCGPVMPQGGIQALEAMLYTLDRLNFAPDTLLPNITIGAHILDDCDKDTYGLEMAVDFIKGSISNIDGAEYHCNKTQVRKVISGVVGAASSVTSIQVANLLRLFKIPQVSFFSTSPELSNKQRFEYFTRTIPSDHYQVKAMVDIVRLMAWSYISIIYEESNYGIKAFEELEDLLAQYNICIAVKEKLVKDSGVADELAYDTIVLKLLTKPRARGCIIFGSDQEVAGVMRAVRRSNATGSFSWIGSDGWSARSLVSDGNEAEVEGTLSVQPQANPVQGFEDYFLSLNVENNPRNPWFVEFWEHHFQCRYPNSSNTPYNQKHGPMCTGREKLSRQNTVFEDQLQFVSDAVMAFAYAIRDMHKDLCHGRPGLCDSMKPTKGLELLKYLKKVDFEGLSGDRFHFDANGDGPARYNIIHFKQVSTGKYRWIRVGEYVEGELRLNMSEIQFKLGHPKPPESVCSFPCDLGQAKKYVEGESCCWHCFNCTQYQIRHPTDPTQCVACPRGTVPDPQHVNCNNIPEEYLRPDSAWAIGAMAFSSTGILITMFVCGVFIRHNDTPVVRASGRELSYVLLAGILMCYSVTYALVLRPNNIVCGIQRFGAGFCFTVVYAALLTKTNRISRIFNAGKHSAKRPSFISPRSQLIICSGLVGVQVLINGVWMVISPARAMHHYPTREDNLLICSSYIDASYMIAFTYPIFLIVVCTVYAVLTRKIPEAFNESKHIGFTMYTTCVIWLAFVPLYFGTANHVALRITSMSVTISLSASVTVACLFSPKLYIILIRPERNVRQSMMPMRYSAINKSSATTGSGSMMAAVMVTAATCDQKQQIQKHVPPIEKEEETDMSESKAKPQMRDISTQTTHPNSSNNMLNSSHEHLPRINNNFNVGMNGPVALLPIGFQIKDL